MTSPTFVANTRIVWLAELVWFNAAWASLVFGHQVMPWLGPVLVMMGVMFSKIRSQLRSVFVIALIGCSIDQILTAIGFFNFQSAQPSAVPTIPYWLVALWLCFSATLHSSLAWLVQKPPVVTMAAFGISGPFSYWVAFKAGAYALPHSLAISMTVLVIVWALFGWLFPRLLKHDSKQVRS
ncbi:DUF2878 domain-containing protein [uncultured Umboniibacter sp.]|uniref:DUF2878 domain-containing protein n=1 Tax=uncultured Umboniibacter sp. TaxID=1798917 RepID=UPI0026317545|nr:DUF2878 domain-containing protein [uncultured Umboniibacter sp.]